MKNTTTLLLAVLIASCFMSSCAIEKRRYTKGYHIDFFGKKSNQKTKDNTVLSKKPESKEVKALESESESKFELSKKYDFSIIPKNLSNYEIRVEFENIHIAEEPSGQLLYASMNRSIDYDKSSGVEWNLVNAEPDNRKTNTLGLLGFILSLLSLLMLFVGGNVAAAVIFLLAAIAGFVLSLLGLLQTSNNKDKYKNIGFPIAGVAVGGLLTILILIAIGSV